MSQARKKSPEAPTSGAAATARAIGSPADGGEPFGTVPRRGKGPLTFWWVVYAAWFAVLIYLAMFTVGDK